MRMRRLKWAHDFLEQQPHLIKEPETMKGKWKQLLNKEILHVEIGCGKGDYWVQMGKRYSESGWIGIEKNESAAALAMRNYVNQGEESHMRFIYGDAATITEWFAPKEVDVIHLNFSDPWPKTRNHKRRLSHAGFLTKYKQILNSEGQIIMKTDNSDLFEFSLLQFQNEGFCLADVSVDFRRAIHEEDVITEYERRFMEKGQPIYRAVFQLRQQGSLD